MSEAALTPEERRARTKARAWALQIHYAWEAAEPGTSVLDALQEVRRSRRIAPERIPHLRRLLEGLDERGSEIDDVVEESLENWRLDRLSSIDRGVLRLAATEILHLDDVPPTVAVSEWVGLAARYGGEESPRFVNGVLDGLRRRREEAGG